MSAPAHSRTGSGPPLLLLHGIGDSWRTWTPVLDRLAARHEVLAVDLPGFGESPPLPEGTTPSPDALAAAVADLLDRHGWDTAHVVGSSLGGWVGLELAALGRTRSVVALSPAGFWSDRDRTRASSMLRLMRRVATALVPPATGTMSARVERLLRTAAGRVLTLSTVVAKPWRYPADAAGIGLRMLASAPAWEATLVAMVGRRYQPPPGGLPVPVTVAWGGKDRLLSAAQRARAREMLPEARVGVLPGCGHLPQWDDPDLVTRVVLMATGQLG